MWLAAADTRFYVAVDYAVVLQVLHRTQQSADDGCDLGLCEAALFCEASAHVGLERAALHERKDEVQMARAVQHLLSCSLPRDRRGCAGGCTSE